MVEPQVLPVRRTLERATPFAYRCAGCGHCCHHKLIQVNPYEVARIARHLGLTTTETLARYTEDGVWLRREADGACCFLAGRGCSVHGDQPLACRLYPLGRRALPDGTEQLVELEPHPRSEGIYGGEGTAEDFLAGQGITEYVAASALYLSVLTRLAAALERRLAEHPEDLGGVDLGPAGGRYPHRGPLPAWLDLDAMVLGAAEPGSPALPADPWAGMQLHVAILERIAATPPEEEEHP